MFVSTNPNTNCKIIIILKKLAKQNAIIRHLSEKTITEKLLFCTSFTLHEFKLYCSYLINVLKKNSNNISICYPIFCLEIYRCRRKAGDRRTGISQSCNKGFTTTATDQS